jgi:23S rRNA pseudouridine1911/1915/1917 synthase
MNPVIKLSSLETHDFWEVPVLYEDACLLALNKPSGLLTSPGEVETASPNLIQLLHQGIAQKKPWAQQRGLSYLMNTHRLDFHASGIVLLAKTKDVFSKLSNLFGSQKPVIRYVALCRGAPKTDSFVIDVKLAHNSIGPANVQVDRQRGKAARTLVQVVERFSGWTLLHCEPLNERLEQVQAHLKHVALPLAGALFYGGRPLMLSSLKPNYRLKAEQTERPLLARAALHAEQIVFPHPESGETMLLTAPWQKDLKVAIKYLRMFARA